MLGPNDDSDRHSSLTRSKGLLTRVPSALCLQRMTAHAAVRWLQKPLERKGYAGSLNTVIEAARDAKYLAIIEDDWMFIKDGNCITAAIDVLESDSSIGQVLFNVGYRETDIKGEEEVALVTDIVEAVTAKGQTYFVQQLHSEEAGFGEVEGKNGDTAADSRSFSRLANFSLWPGVTRMSALEYVGPFDEEVEKGMPSDSFKHAYAGKWTEAGYKTAFFPEVHCIHLAPSEWVRNRSYGSAEVVEAMFMRHGLEGISVSSGRDES